MSAFSGATLRQPVQILHARDSSRKATVTMASAPTTLRDSQGAESLHSVMCRCWGMAD